MKFKYGLIMASLCLIVLGLWASGVISDASAKPHAPLWTALGETEIRGGVTCYDDTEWDGFCDEVVDGPCTDQNCIDMSLAKNSGGLSSSYTPVYKCVDTERTLNAPAGAWRDDCLEIHAGSEFCTTAPVNCGFAQICYENVCNGPDSEGHYKCSQFSAGGRTETDHYAAGDTCL